MLLKDVNLLVMGLMLVSLACLSPVESRSFHLIKSRAANVSKFAFFEKRRMFKFQFNLPFAFQFASGGEESGLMRFGQGSNCRIHYMVVFRLQDIRRPVLICNRGGAGGGTVF